MAAENGHEQVADVLLWHKAFVNAKSKLGLTPLHLAAQNGYNDLVRLLIETHSAVIDALSLVRTHQYYKHEYANQQITISFSHNTIFSSGETDPASYGSPVRQDGGLQYFTENESRCKRNRCCMYNRLLLDKINSKVNF